MEGIEGPVEIYSAAQKVPDPGKDIDFKKWQCSQRTLKNDFRFEEEKMCSSSVCPVALNLGVLEIVTASPMCGNQIRLGTSAILMGIS